MGDMSNPPNRGGGKRSDSMRYVGRQRRKAMHQGLQEDGFGMKKTILEGRCQSKAICVTTSPHSLPLGPSESRASQLLGSPRGRELQQQSCKVGKTRGERARKGRYWQNRSRCNTMIQTSLTMGGAPYSVSQQFAQCPHPSFPCLHLQDDISKTSNAPKRTMNRREGQGWRGGASQSHVGGVSGVGYDATSATTNPNLWLL